MAAPFDPVVFFLAGPASIALRRARARGGRTNVDALIAYLRQLPALAEWRESPSAELVDAWGARLRAVWEAAGSPSTVLSADVTPDKIVAAALAHLGARAF
jgi:hypothetical protein